MDVVFEIDRNNHTVIEDIKSCKYVKQVYETNGFNGIEVVTIIVALINSVKDLILKYVSNPSVTIKISNEFGSVEITAKSVEQAERQIDAYLDMAERRMNNIHGNL